MHERCISGLYNYCSRVLILKTKVVNKEEAKSVLDCLINNTHLFHISCLYGLHGLNLS